MAGWQKADLYAPVRPRGFLTVPDGQGIFMCATCGAVVADPDIHLGWHSLHPPADQPSDPVPVDPFRVFKLRDGPDPDDAVLIVTNEPDKYTWEHYLALLKPIMAAGVEPRHRVVVHHGAQRYLVEYHPGGE